MIADKLTLDVLGARVLDTRFSVAVATEPGLIPELLLALVTSLDVLLQVLAIDQVSAKYILAYKPH